jgi:hypothetical protein
MAMNDRATDQRLKAMRKCSSEIVFPGCCLSHVAHCLQYQNVRLDGSSGELCEVEKVVGKLSNLDNLVRRTAQCSRALIFAI